MLEIHERFCPREGRRDKCPLIMSPTLSEIALRTEVALSQICQVLWQILSPITYLFIVKKFPLCIRSVTHSYRHGCVCTHACMNVCWARTCVFTFPKNIYGYMFLNIIFFVKIFGTKYLRERNLTDGNVSNRNESIGEDLSIKEWHFIPI